MTYLLDTHALIWAIMHPDRLSEKVVQIIEDPAHQILISAVSFWEISLKYALGKLELNHISPEDLPAICSKSGFELLPLEADVCAGYHQLSKIYHKDPFGRMLIWQAKCLKIPLLSKDESIKQYESEGISVIW